MDSKSTSKDMLVAAAPSSSSSGRLEEVGGRLTQSAKVVLLATAFVDILGFALPNPLMPYYFDKIPGFSQARSGLFFGLIMSSFSIGQFVGSLSAGIVSDRFGRRLPILVCLLGNAAMLLYTAFAPDIFQLLAARGGAGLFAGTQSVCSAYVSDLTTKSERPRELAHLSVAITVGFVAGPAIGIAIGLSFGIERIQTAFQVTCLVAAGIATMAFVAGLFFLRDSRRPGELLGTEQGGRQRSIWSTIGGLLRTRNILLVLLIAFMGQFVGTALEVAMPLVLVQEQKSEIWQVLIVFATMAIATPLLVGLAYETVSQKLGQKMTIIVGTLGQGVGMFFFPIFLFWYIQAPLAILLAFGSLADPPLQLVATMSARRAYGTTMGMLRSIGALARIVAPGVAGALYDVEFGAFIGKKRLLPFWLGTALTIVISVVVLFLRKTEVSEDSSSDEEEEPKVKDNDLEEGLNSGDVKDDDDDDEMTLQSINKG